MKHIPLILSFFLFFLVSCGTGAAVETRTQAAGSVSRPTLVVTRTPNSELSITPTIKPTGDPHNAPYPAATPSDLGADADQTTVPEPYPGLSVEAGSTSSAELPVDPEITPLIEVLPESLKGQSGYSSYSYERINEYPHDRGSFVQGLVFDEEPGILLEGSGLWGESSLRRVDLETGAVLQKVELPPDLFGEGITLFNDRIYQLTWKSGRGFVYDSSSFELIGEFNYAHQGWGITHDGVQLIVSDGTDVIHYWDPVTLKETGQIRVYDELGPVTQLNELEFIGGEIFANVWQTDTIVRIDPESGQVLGRIDLTGLLAPEDRIGTEGVLNGIAYDEREGRLFVTGKRWPKLFEIRLVASEDSQ